MFPFKMYSNTLFIICSIHLLKYSNVKASIKCPKKLPNNYNDRTFDERIDEMPEECYCSNLPSDCARATACTKRSGIYKIRVHQFSYTPFYVVCDNRIDNGDWLVIQRRQDGSQYFYLNWDLYERGFGSIDGEFFIGLKKLHALTNYNGPQELLIVMEGPNGTIGCAKYESFAIGDKSESYYLKRMGRFSGNAGNSLRKHMNMKFTTKDRDNDMSPGLNCAVKYTGAWWYNNCHDSNLNGKYGENSIGRGVNWFHFTGYKHSLVYVKMMIRRIRSI